MPTSKQAAKRLRQDKKRAAHNTLLKENISYLRRYALKQIEAKDSAKAQEFVLKFQKAVDKATKSYLHKNTAARMKSRLRLKFNALFPSSAQGKVQGEITFSEYNKKL